MSIYPCQVAPEDRLTARKWRGGGIKGVELGFNDAFFVVLSQRDARQLKGAKELPPVAEEILEWLEWLEWMEDNE